MVCFQYYWHFAAADADADAGAGAAAAAVAAVSKYPSSSHYTRDWDKLVTDIKAEEKEEKPEGDQALNQLFQQIYRDGNEETRKAMNKSFVRTCSILFLSLYIWRWLNIAF